MNTTDPRIARQRAIFDAEHAHMIAAEEHSKFVASLEMMRPVLAPDALARGEAHAEELLRRVAVADDAIRVAREALAAEHEGIVRTLRAETDELQIAKLRAAMAPTVETIVEALEGLREHLSTLESIRLAYNDRARAARALAGDVGDLGELVAGIQDAPSSYERALLAHAIYARDLQYVVSELPVIVEREDLAPTLARMLDLPHLASSAASELVYEDPDLFADALLEGTAEDVYRENARRRTERIERDTEAARVSTLAARADLGFARERDLAALIDEANRTAPELRFPENRARLVEIVRSLRGRKLGETAAEFAARAADVAAADERARKLDAADLMPLGADDTDAPELALRETL